MPFSHFQCLFSILYMQLFRVALLRADCLAVVQCTRCASELWTTWDTRVWAEISSRFARYINATCTHRFKVDEATSVEKQTESMLHMPPTIPAHHSQGSLLPPQENNAARARSMTPAPKKMIQMTTPTAI